MSPERRRSINHPVYLETKRSEIDKFIDSIPRQSVEIQSGYSEMVQGEITKFREHVISTYNTLDRSFILNALDFAVVAHEKNQIKQNRTRKEPVNGEVVPYIVHPIAIAGALAGLNREVELPITDNDGAPVILPVRQHPYKAEVVVAGLLHDIIEDVHLHISGDSKDKKKPKVSIGRINRDIEWNEFIKEFFSSKNVFEDRIEDVITMVNAVTKYDSTTISEEIRQEILSSPLYQIYTKRLQKLSPTQEKEERDSQAERVLLDIHKIFRTTLFNEETGLVEINNVTLKRFYGALAIKCQDVINNLETGGVSNAKLVRAHILAHVARIFGLPSASQLGVHLITGNNYDVFSDTQNITEEKLRMITKYCEFEVDPSLRPLMKLDDLAFVPNAVQIPINSTSEQRLSKKHEFNPALQYRVTASEEIFELLAKKRAKKQSTHVVFSIGGVEHTLHTIKTQTQKSIRLSGRKCEYYNAVGPEGKVTAIIRFQDNKPSAHTILSLVSDEDADGVPEHAFVLPFNGAASSTMRVIGAMSPFSLPKAA